ncbi:MAG: FAD-dependent oxidoreductase [Bryobacteraceae bacterium]
MIVGAGIIGASIAWRLSQAGFTVTLVDAGNMGGEASWAGAGMLAPGGEVSEESEWARFALESLALYPAFVRELESESGDHIDLRLCGALEIAGTEDEWKALQERRVGQQAMGIRAEEAAPVAGAAGALFFPDDAIVDPRDVMHALRTVCRNRGIKVLEQVRVNEIRMVPARVDLLTSAGTLSASAAVLAAGAWSGDIGLSSSEIPVEIARTFPVRGHLLGYSLPPGSLGHILRRGHTYLLQRTSGFTIAGTSSEMAGFDRNLDPAIIADIARRATELWPVLRSSPEPQAWVGFRPATGDYQPRIGRLAGTDLWLAYGHYRNGILLAPATAQRISRQMAA